MRLRGSVVLLLTLLVLLQLAYCNVVVEVDISVSVVSENFFQVCGSFIVTKWSLGIWQLGILMYIFTFLFVVLGFPQIWGEMYVVIVGISRF